VPHLTWKTRFILGLVALAATIVLVPFQEKIWDGGFPSTEYRLTFIDAVGRPVSGVTLPTETRAGGVCYLYPVDEFVTDEAPASDADGRMVFHHVGDHLEFGGREHSNLLGMRFGVEGAPQYVCVFRVAGREIHRLPYDELYPRGDRDSLPTVTRTWQSPDWPKREYVAHRAEWSDYRRRLHGANGDGKLDREESVAARHFDRVIIDAEAEGEKRDIRFFVIERTITISMP
jgi:hypothetical protein